MLFFVPFLQGDRLVMDWHEDDDRYGCGDDSMSARSRRTKFRFAADEAWTTAKRIKRSGKRSHRQRTMKDDFWSGRDH
jgi:hypothetical protein